MKIRASSLRCTDTEPRHLLVSLSLPFESFYLPHPLLAYTRRELRNLDDIVDPAIGWRA
jgi:hypothetical protein